ncbi:EAL domain-containing protein [Amycolatopsis sp. PS_44_ISF1]|uniref:EAL domain-containing protein n=1 Tax=Amycolatopsis sp. PS_44_ISF1 TaxID=2974917 RepID=UPI0028DF07FB|nr:EAL domain-containing protein [Amycolatopsis sp. PS_44_ISF1]MDT8913733.1 EAL domain-containing protein [Amycolatopsis sp. PS_44_ISF1]MDT8916206.1 EAL domain-containing protein [Amycolatopsis sp. PS_44_ISF1]
MTDPAPRPMPSPAARPRDAVVEYLDQVFDRIRAAAPRTGPAAAPVADEAPASRVDRLLLADTAAGLATLLNPVTPGLRLTADDAVEFGRRWLKAMADKAYLTTHPRFADQDFGRWTAILLHHLGASLDRAEELLDPDRPMPSPREVGRELSYAHKLSADALGACVCLLSDLSTEFTPHAPRRVRARVVGDFAGGFATGLRDRVRDDQTLLGLSLVRAHNDNPAGAAHQPRPRTPEPAAAVLTLDRHGRIVEANDAAQALLGRTFAELRDQNVAALAGCESDADVLRGAVEQVAGAPQHTVTRIELQLPADHYTPARWIAATFGHAHDTQRGVSVLLSDVTLLRGLAHSADRNCDTGLLSASVFTDEAEARLQHPPAGGMALLTVRIGARRDLDHVLTQDMHDRLLTRIHTQILAITDPDCPQLLAGHSHGDGDVLVLLSGLPGWEVVTRLVTQLADWMSNPVRVGGHRLRLHPRIGIAEVQPGDTLKTVLHRTRRARRDPGRCADPVIHAEPAEDADHHHTLTALAELDDAIHNTRLSVRYQPVCTPEGMLSGIRPVASWTGPDGRLGRLADVAELAEQTGLLAAALPLMLDLACRDIYTWTGVGHTPQILLDLPGRAVHDDTLLDALTAKAATAALQPGQLQLVIPATALTAAPPVLTRLAELSHSGCSLALSGAYGDAWPAAALTDLPWDTIGLDPATVGHLTRRGDTTLLTSTLATIHALHARPLAENQPAPLPGFALYQPGASLSAADVHTELGTHTARP